ncbi:holo-[acyl-carrier-protein] synthase [Ehrlichia ruminantium]|uniref:Holo-[acyl-carrier-protein] synthase n=1 Tax=Ehrlichia ruminantium TaxID=779 RepID=A0AAE6Q8V7_EHRRU|nr:holo-[acyl-carrier-protein] synthase [Ehrlichia ruminantium]QGR02413.1 holo-[acyl-carrier-protein] synthase [Ehrlichia ruminantium]QGR03332.1 holo-[acyl-carrier-protein] synthase [Ehrlichia ruminantium]QGR04259.1 holo-[acyl-carrier-protein] synthase [Ehrlichia ruminantium]
MIVGIGTDIVYIPRILNLWKKFGTKFLTRVFSEEEIKDSNRYTSLNGKIRHFAKRFAAKEAYVKALGTGFGKAIKMSDITIYNTLDGKPKVSINNSSINYKIELSLSDDTDYAIAFIIIHKELQ